MLAAGCGSRHGLTGTIVPADRDAAALHQRLEFGFADLVDALDEHPDPVALPLPAAEIAAQALAALPTSFDTSMVVLHSNPSPNHVFVDPDRGTMTGVIDFGDAYTSHPALDLHRWRRRPTGSVTGSRRHGGAVDFDHIWTVAMIYTDLAVIAAGSPHTGDAIADLPSAWTIRDHCIPTGPAGGEVSAAFDSHLAASPLYRRKQRCTQ